MCEADFLFAGILGVAGLILGVIGVGLYIQHRNSKTEKKITEKKD